VFTRSVIASMVLAFTLFTGAWGQPGRRQPTNDNQFPGPPTRPTDSPYDPAAAEMRQRMMKQMNKERFAHIKKDTDQLLTLATQLKKSVDEANDQTLSLEVVRKAEQIEKLAKNVKEKMRGN
jgi:hypothetical protein